MLESIWKYIVSLIGVIIVAGLFVSWLISDPSLSVIGATTPNLWMDAIICAGIIGVAMALGSLAGVVGMMGLGFIGTLIAMNFSLFGTLALLGVMVISTILYLIAGPIVLLLLAVLVICVIATTYTGPFLIMLGIIVGAIIIIAAVTAIVYGVANAYEDRKNSIVYFKPSNKPEDEKYNQAVTIVLREKKVSAVEIKRWLAISFDEAKDYIARMEAEGIVRGKEIMIDPITGNPKNL